MNNDDFYDIQVKDMTVEQFAAFLRYQNLPADSIAGTAWALARSWGNMPAGPERDAIADDYWTMRLLQVDYNLPPDYPAQKAMQEIGQPRLA